MSLKVLKKQSSWCTYYGIGIGIKFLMIPIVFDGLLLLGKYKLQCFCWLSGVSDVLVGLDRGGSSPPCVPYVLSACWQGGHGPFWPLALAPLRWLTSFLHNRVRAQIIPAYSAALPFSSSTYTPIKSTYTHTHTLFQIHIHVYQPWNNAIYAMYCDADNVWGRAHIYSAYLTGQLSYVQIPCVFFNKSPLPELCNAP